MMMRCTNIVNQIDDYLDGTMSLGKQKAVEAHIHQCRSCQQLLDDSKAIRQALRDLPVELASPDFEEKVFTAAFYNNKDNHKRKDGRFVAGFATAIAASITLWFASTIYTTRFDADSPQVVNLALNQSRTVKLVFDSPKDLTEVTLSLELPANIELEGFIGKKQLVWQTNLTRGQNVLALPLIAIDSGQGELVAKLNYSDKVKQFHVVLKTDNDGAFIYRLIPFKSA
jgi:hypothetical protein